MEPIRMSQFVVQTTVNYLVNAYDAEEAIEFVDDKLEGDAYTWTRPVVQVQNV